MSKAEKYISDCTRNCSNELCAVEDRFGKKVISYHDWLTPHQARKAVEIAREEMVERACKWLKENLPYSAKPPYQVIEDLRKAIKGGETS